MENLNTLEQELEKIQNKIKDAEENLGDIEVRDAILEKAALYEKFNQTE
jgi:26S proteasome regulatory subunit N7